VRDAIVASARQYAADDGVVRLRNETVCFSAHT